MPKAANTTTTPTRRAVFRDVGLASIAAGLAARSALAAPAAKTDADAVELIALAKTLAEQRDVANLIEAEAKTLPPAAAEASKDQERRLDLAMDNWMATAEQMVDIPAQSLAGLRAKAEGVELLVAYFSSSFVNVEDRLARSLARDLLAGSAVA